MQIHIYDAHADRHLLDLRIQSLALLAEQGRVRPDAPSLHPRSGGGGLWRRSSKRRPEGPRELDGELDIDGQALRGDGCGGLTRPAAAEHPRCGLKGG